jgi:hypothetical protein
MAFDQAKFEAFLNKSVGGPRCGDERGNGGSSAIPSRPRSAAFFKR